MGIFDADLQERKSHRCMLAERAPVAAVRRIWRDGGSDRSA